MTETDVGSFPVSLDSVIDGLALATRRILDFDNAVAPGEDVELMRMPETVEPVRGPKRTLRSILDSVLSGAGAVQSAGGPCGDGAFDGELYGAADFVQALKLDAC